jgi:hypothetical protein
MVTFTITTSELDTTPLHTRNDQDRNQDRKSMEILRLASKSGKKEAPRLSGDISISIRALLVF